MAEKEQLRSKARLLIGVTVIAVAAGWAGLRLFGGSPPPLPPPPPQFAAPANEILVASLSGNAIIGFEVSSAGVINASSVRVIGGGLSGQWSGLLSPFWLAVDSGGRIFTTNLGDQVQPSSSSAQPPRITVHEVNANGATAPFTQLDRGAIGYANPRGLVVRRNPIALFIVNRDDAGQSNVLEAELPNGGPRINSLSGPALALTDPAGIALDSASNVYVADAATNSVKVYSALRPFTSCSTCAPVRTLAGASTALDRPVGLAFDSTGKLYVTNFRHDQSNYGYVSVYHDSQGNIGGNMAPVRILGVPFGSGNTPPQLRRPLGIAFNQLDVMFVTQDDEVLVFAAGASGNAAPTQRVTHPKLSQAAGIAFRHQ